MRRGRVIGLVVLGITVLVGLCALTVSLSVPLLKQGGAVADEWQGRLAKDYPGWKSVGFNVNSFSGSSGSQTNYAFAMVPPGRNFTVGIVYRSEGGQPAVSQDEVLRPGGAYNNRAVALLDFIEANYIKQGKTVTSVTSDSAGEVTVDWQRVTQVGCLSSRIGSFDTLRFNDSTSTWTIGSSGP